MLIINILTNKKNYFKNYMLSINTNNYPTPVEANQNHQSKVHGLYIEIITFILLKVMRKCLIYSLLRLNTQLKHLKLIIILTVFYLQ